MKHIIEIVNIENPVNNALAINDISSLVFEKNMLKIAAIATRKRARSVKNLEAKSEILFCFI